MEHTSFFKVQYGLIVLVLSLCTIQFQDMAYAENKCDCGSVKKDWGFCYKCRKPPDSKVLFPCDWYWTDSKDCDPGTSSQPKAKCPERPGECVQGTAWRYGLQGNNRYGDIEIYTCAVSYCYGEEWKTETYDNPCECHKYSGCLGKLAPNEDICTEKKKNGPRPPRGST